MNRVMGWFFVAIAVASGQQYPFLPVPESPKIESKLFQDSQGRLWIVGGEPACFDGARFFFLRDYGFPPSVESFDIAEDPSGTGTIWIAAETGVYRFSGGRVEQVNEEVATSIIAVSREMAVAAEGPAGKGVSRNAALIRIERTEGKWKSETVMSLGSPGPITLDPSGMLLYPVTTKYFGEIRLQDVVHWHAGTQIAVIRHGPPGGTPVNGVWKIMRDHSGCWWGGAPGRNAYDCGDGSHSAPFVGANMMAAMHEASDGRMLLVGNSLLAIGRPGSFQIATRANGLPGMEDAIAARDGTIWLATTDGLYRFASPFRIEYWTVREGLPDPPWSVARIGHRMYVGLDRKIAALTSDRLRWDVIAKFGGGGLVSALLGVEDGALFAAFIGGGAAQLSTDGKVLAHTRPDHPVSGSMRLARARNGEIWLGGQQLGILTRAGAVLKFASHPLQTQPSGNVLGIKYEDHTHRLWACYNGGLVLRDERGDWREFSTRNGLRVNDCWSVAPLPNGDIWYAYRNFPGFSRVRLRIDGNISIREYGRDGVNEPGSDTFDADHDGRLWRGGSLGIYVAGVAQAEAGDWLQLDRSDGFPASDMNSGSVFVDSDGSLWWGADNDLAHYTPPQDLVSPSFAPQVFVSAFSWENQAPKLAEAVGSLPHGSKIVAHIGSLQFDRRNALRLRYRLLPEQTKWQETKSLDLALGVLGSGDHRLEVQGRVFTGPWSQTASRSFQVLRPAWLAWPLMAGYFMLAVMLAGGGYWLYSRQRAESAQLLPDLAPWRLGALVPEVQQFNGMLLDSRFAVGRLLARGGFANVMEGYDRSRQERCAVKIFRTEVKDKGWIQRSFDQEVAALEKVQHPNVVSINAYGRTAAGAPYLVMEFVEGRSLREVLEDGALAARRTGQLLRQLGGALAAIHAQRICHRDLKPENIIVRNEGTVQEEAVLIDFSIAIIKDADETLHGLSRAAGTFDYMAPEQAVGYAQPSSDIYSLSRVVIEMLTGRLLKDLLPGAGLDLPDRVRALMRGLTLHLSDESIELLATALEFDPARRPSDAVAFSGPLVRDLESNGMERTF